MEEKAYTWDAEPGEYDSDHTHPFDTHIEVLEGEITITMNGNISILKSGESISIPRGVLHSGKAGSNGCKYRVTEKY